MKNYVGCRQLIGKLLIVPMLLIAQKSNAADAGRLQISPSAHPLAKLVVEVAQVDGDLFFVGNGFVVGVDGCHVLTNVHVAYGKGRDANGDIVFVENIETGHVVEVGMDLNSRTGTYARKIKAIVVEFGNYKAKDKRKARNDLAILKLDDCLGVHTVLRDSRFRMRR